MKFTFQGITIIIPEKLANQLDIDEVKRDLQRTCIRIKNRYTKIMEKK